MESDMVIRGATQTPFIPLDLERLQMWANPFGSLGSTGGVPMPFSPLFGGGDMFSLEDLPDDREQDLKRFIEANKNQFDGAVDTPEELRKLMQMLHMGEGKSNALPKLETKPGADLQNMNAQELLQLLIDYLSNFGNENNQNRPQPRMLPQNLSGGGGGGGGGGGMSTGGGGGMSTGGGGGGGGTGASGPITRSNGTVSGTPDIAGAQNLSAEQKQNAQTIINVGRQMGASERDIQIALMTAMQESNLRNLNYGDRDSLGLFQQRPSQGWGTPEQVTNPEYAAKKFYEGLLRIENRDQMSLTQAAQAVQRSAFPDAYAKWEGLAAGLMNELGSGGRRNDGTMVA